MVPNPITGRRPKRAASCLLFAAVALALRPAPVASAAQDVLLQTMGPKIVLGSVDDQSFTGELGARVHSGAFNSSFLTSNPGFLSFAHGNFNLPPGAEGFPSLHDVNFDLLPLTVGSASANLFFWSGADLDGNGLTAADVAFAPPTTVDWQVLNGSSTWITADGTDTTVTGGLIQRTSSDIDPGDGVNSGAMHKHLAIRVVDAGGGAPPAQGIYLVAWQIRSAGFDSSDPLLMLHRTSGASAAALTIAQAWAEANYDALTTELLPGDFDGNGQVDGNDFLTWQRTLGTPAGTNLSVWRNAMSGGSATIAAAAVPEPAAAVLAAATALAVLTRLRRKTPGAAGRDRKARCRDRASRSNLAVAFDAH